MGQTFFHHVEPGLEIFSISCQEWLVHPYPLSVVYWKTLNLYRKFQFIGNFKITLYLVTIVGQHFQLLKFHIKIRGMAGKQCSMSFFCPKSWKRSLLFETLAEMLLAVPSSKTTKDIRKYLILATLICYDSFAHFRRCK